MYFVEDFKFLLPLKFVALRSEVSEEMSKMSQQIRGLFSHISFLICLKNTKLVEDVEFLNRVKFLLILFNGFRREVN